MNLVELMNEMISKVNIDALGAYIMKTDKSAEYTSVNLRPTLETWAMSKAHIYEMFGRELKVSTPVECIVSKTDVGELLSAFFEEFSSKRYLLANKFLCQLSIEELTDNYLKDNYQVFDVKLSKGMRVSRCLKQLLLKDDVEEYQTKFSMFLQKLKVQGKAVISIDPMDYITMSVNKSGWKSCHNIASGCYKAGCLSYLIDDSTAISYTTDKQLGANAKYEGLYYDNKLWRQCVHFGGKIGIQARQYPSINSSNSGTIGKLMAELYEKKTGEKYERENMFAEDLLEYQEDHGGHAYNDIERESFSKGGALIRPVESSTMGERVQINNDALCVCCGQDIVYGEEYLVCEDCSCDLDYDIDVE
jgi:hypothetical protein